VKDWGGGRVQVQEYKDAGKCERECEEEKEEGKGKEKEE